MNPPAPPFVAAPPRARLPLPCRPEAEAVGAALARVGALDWPAVVSAARPWVEGARAHPAPFWAMESLLREYPISSAEGLALMRLAEALLRVPDAHTAVALTADQLGRADFDSDAADGAHRMLASLSASAIALSKKFLPETEQQSSVLQRLGAKTVVAATVRAIGLLGRQFVLGRNIAQALSEAAGQRQAHASLSFSYDMLGVTFGALPGVVPRSHRSHSTGRPRGGCARSRCTGEPRPAGRRRHLDQAQRAVLAL